MPLDILGPELKAWAKKEKAIVEALKEYRRGKRQPLLKLFDASCRSIPRSLFRGIRDILAGKRGAPPKLTASEQCRRQFLAMWVHAAREDGATLEDACLETAESFGASESIIKHAYLKHFPSPRSRSKKTDR